MKECSGRISTMVWHVNTIEGSFIYTSSIGIFYGMCSDVKSCYSSVKECVNSEYYDKSKN